MAGAIHRAERSRLRRRAMRLGYANGLLWAVGNALTSGTLIYYLAMELGAGGMGVGVLLATPAMVGILRLGAPRLIAWCGGAKRACLAATTLSYVFIVGLPLVVLAGPRLGTSAVFVLVALLCVHQLLEYMGTVALWTWFADLIPRRIRGRYFSRRQIWQLAGLIPVLWLGSAVVDAFKQTAHPLWGYALVTAVGAAALLASLVPLVWMPASLGPASGRGMTPFPRYAWSDLIAVFRDRPFLGLLAFGVWYSVFNGLTQSPQYIYPKMVLGLSLLPLVMTRTVMPLAQMGNALWIGPFSDRYGNRPVLVLCQWLIGIAPLFFVIATPDAPYWIVGAWLCWSAYAGLNICGPNLVLRMAGRRDPAPYVATYFGLTSLAYAISTVLGGRLFDELKAGDWHATFGPWQLDYFTALFLFACLTRTAGVFWLARVAEPGAWSWRRILGSKRATWIDPAAGVGEGTFPQS